MKQIIILIIAVSFSTNNKAIGQYGLPVADGTACSKLTRTKMREFANHIKVLVDIAAQDKATYGSGYTHSEKAHFFFTASKNAYDSVIKTVRWLETSGDGNPETTIYSEAGGILQDMWDVMDNLRTANWWSSLGAVYNRSEYASCGKEKSLRLLAEALQLLVYSDRCYIGAYREVPPCK